MAFPPTNRASPHGFDLYVGPVGAGIVDMTREGRACSGPELVRNALVWRCMADTISEINAPGGVVAFGRDVRAWVGSPMTDAIAKQRQQELTVIFNGHPCIDPAGTVVEVRAARAGSQYALAIDVTARTTDALPIAFLLGISALTVDILADRAQV